MIDLIGWAYQTAMAIAWFRCALIAAEIAMRCHCGSWVWTEHGARCTSPIGMPRCELISGWHPIAFGVNTCTKGDCPGDDPPWARDVPMPERPDRRWR